MLRTISARELAEMAVDFHCHGMRDATEIVQSVKEEGRSLDELIRVLAYMEQKMRADAQFLAQLEELFSARPFESQIERAEPIKTTAKAA